MPAFLTLGLLLAPLAAGQAVFPAVKDVNAMCTADGITASITFDRPFSGLIYSVDYAQVHGCVYYNALLSLTVLFSIPTHGCGTYITHNTHDVLETVENRVYVQMDKLTQTAADRQFSFVCQQAYVTSSAGFGGDVRRHPVASKSTYHGQWRTPITPVTDGTPPPFGRLLHPLGSLPSPDWRYNEIRPEVEQKPVTPADHLTDLDFRLGSLQHLGERRAELDSFGRTVSTADTDLLEPVESVDGTPQTAHPFTLPPLGPGSTSPVPPGPAPSTRTRMTARQTLQDFSDSVVMEIQRGRGPFSDVVNGTVTIGELLSLVTRANSSLDHYDMFVHSCYATDANHTVRLDLVDQAGCSAHSMVLEPVRRVRAPDGQLVSFFPFKAFKFPTAKDLFFSCSVEVSPDKDLPELCAGSKQQRKRAIILPLSERRHLQLFLVDSVQIEDRPPTFQRVEGRPSDDEEGVSAVGLLLGGVVLCLGLLGLALVVLLFRSALSPSA